MLRPNQRTAMRIKRLEVQDARNVAIAAVKAIETLAKARARKFSATEKELHSKR